MTAKEKLETTAREIVRIADARGIPDADIVSIGLWSEPQPTGVPGVMLPEFKAIIALTIADFREFLKRPSE